MFSYLAFLYSGVEACAGRPQEDGEKLARHCVKQLRDLNDPEQFPPRLLILLTSPAYLELSKAGDLLAAINETFTDEGFPDTPLIGCSAAAVFFNRRVRTEGALLICLASRLLEAEVAVGTNVAEEPEKAVNDLLNSLGLHAGEGEDPNPFSNRTLFTFLPGFHEMNYLAPQLHQLLRQNLYARVPIFGGVTTSDFHDRVKPGILFANREARHSAIIAARIVCGTPLGVSFSHGLTITERVLRIASFSEKKKEIYSFYEKSSVAELMRELEEENQVALLAEIAADRHPVIENPGLTDSGQSLRMMRNIHKDTIYKVAQPWPERIQEAVQLGVRYAQMRARAENPISCLALKSTGLLRFRQKIGLDFEQEFAAVEGALDIRQNNIPKSYVGAFVDGEAVVDDDGRSLLRNWSTAVMLFCDELSDHTPVYRGFEKMANLNETLLAPADESIQGLLQLIYEIGFPGAMISFWLPDDEQERIVAKTAVGSRYNKIVSVTRPPIDSDDALAFVVREKRPTFISDSRKAGSRCNQQLVSHSGVISQYIVPLAVLRDEIGAVLQFDLGDASYKTDLHPTERQALDSIAMVVSANLNRIISREENRIILQLDRALKECLSAETIGEGMRKYLGFALNAFGLRMGHIRIAQEEKHSLSLVAGIGDYYEANKDIRKESDFSDLSQTAQAFREDRLIIVNDAANNPTHRQMCQRWKDKRILDALTGVGSYACVPFTSEQGARGVVSFIAHTPWFFNRHHGICLLALSERAGFLVDHFRNKQIEKEARQSELAVKATGAYIFQSAHRLGNLLQIIYSKLSRISEADMDEKRKGQEINKLIETVEAGMRTLRMTRDVGERVLRPASDRHRLDEIILKALSEVAADEPISVRIDKSALERIIVRADQDHLKQVFINLLDNAIAATRGRDNPELAITAEARADNRAAVVTVKENGIGMTEEEMQAAMRGFFSTHDHKGVGVLISRVLLNANGGSLAYRSVKGIGTETIVTLPLASSEETL